MGEKIHEFLSFAFDNIIFVISLTALLTLAISMYKYTSNVQDACYYNTTVSKTMPENTMYNGYVVNGKTVYDGEISGKQVYTDILNSSETNILIKNPTRYDLSTKMHENQNMLAYARNDNPTILITENVINVDATYLRKFIRDTSGNVTQIIYEKQ